MKKKLEFQADRIEAVLSAHKVPARVTGGTVTPRWCRFTVLPAVGAKISNIKNLSDEMAAALSVPKVKIARRGAAVDIEIPRDDPQPVRLLPLYNQLTNPPTDQPTNHSSIPPVTAILGLAEDGAPLLIRLPSPDVGHILITGLPGAGKTMLLKAMILSLAMENDKEKVRIILIGEDFECLRALPHLARPPVHGEGEAKEVLQSLSRMIDRRLGLPAMQGSTQSITEPRIIVFIDDLDKLISVDPKGVGRDLTKITPRGREVGIHVVVATGNTDVAAIAPGFPVRIVGRVASASDARIVSGTMGTGAERLLGKGDFIAIAEGKCQRFQAAYVSDEEIRETVRQLMNDTPMMINNGVRP